MPSGRKYYTAHEEGRLTEPWLRSFLTRAYPTMKHHNPYTPIMIREAQGIEPRVYARYEFGREQVADLKGKAMRQHDSAPAEIY